MGYLPINYQQIIDIPEEMAHEPAMSSVLISTENVEGVTDGHVQENFDLTFNMFLKDRLTSVGIGGRTLSWRKMRYDPISGNSYDSGVGGTILTDTDGFFNIIIRATSSDIGKVIYPKIIFGGD